MPGAAHGVIDEEPLGERPAIMRAGGADREHLLAASCQQHRLIADMAEQHGAVGEFREGETVGEIGPAQLRLSFAHHSISSLEFLDVVRPRGELDRIQGEC
jgi:hypothetical protein